MHKKLRTIVRLDETESTVVPTKRNAGELALPASASRPRTRTRTPVSAIAAVATAAAAAPAAAAAAASTHIEREVRTEQRKTRAPPRSSRETCDTCPEIKAARFRSGRVLCASMYFAEYVGQPEVGSVKRTLSSIRRTSELAVVSLTSEEVRDFSDLLPLQK